MVDGSNIEIARIRSGWRVDWGEVRLDAESPHFDRGAIRATLTVRNGAAIYFRDTANLTSARARARIIQQLAEKGVTIEDRAIIALDEAYRTRPRPPEEQVVRHEGPDTSERVLEFRALQGTVTSWLLLGDPDVLPVTLGAQKAHDLGGQPPWLLLVAPPFDGEYALP